MTAEGRRAWHDWCNGRGAGAVAEAIRQFGGGDFVAAPGDVATDEGTREVLEGASLMRRRSRLG
ncbi:hypothetical protein GCM10022255_055530 [Dactylosporangium darangshiense]|uniref:Uncharacterized protein n=1 Tax=Dactylosporangium darangshiense TaxID=579108 RepID=A0ABP8DE09_9ACTN